MERVLDFSHRQLIDDRRSDEHRDRPTSATLTSGGAPLTAQRPHRIGTATAIVKPWHRRFHAPDLLLDRWRGPLNAIEILTSGASVQVAGGRLSLMAEG
ncbi:MAG: hypothetical protein ACLP62_15690 [Acidimicrobiales bacterium]